MRTKQYKKGEYISRLNVLKDLIFDNEEVERLFKTVLHPDEMGKFFGGKTQQTTKDFKATLIIEEM